MKMGKILLTDDIKTANSGPFTRPDPHTFHAGNEGPASRYLAEQIGPYVDICRLVDIPDSIQDDPDYAFRLPNFSYTEIRLKWNV